MEELPDPVPGENELPVKVGACGVCHTELDEIEGRTPPPRFPIVLGHQIVGRVEALGAGSSRFSKGERVGVAWIFSACGTCSLCLSNLENLCPDFKATGRDVNGGYAEYMTVPSSFAYRIPDAFTDADAAPLLCAGAIGYRSLRLTGLTDGKRLGLTGFGASAHLVLKMARHRFPHSEIFVFSRSERERAFAEKEIKSVANVARSDVEEFLALAAAIPLRPEVQEFPLSGANVALGELRTRTIRGAKVLVVE
jgi:propanol-preferring alcohol dehydrogenase